MKLSVYILACLVAVTPVIGQQVVANGQSSSSGTASGRLITLVAKDVTIHNALKAIAKQSGMQLFLNESNRALNRRISVQIRNVPVVDALNSTTYGTGVTAYVSGGNSTIVVLSTEKGSSAKEEGVIIGRVTDAKSGKGIVGAKVSIGNDTRGSATGEDGSYRLSRIVSGTHTVSVRSIGYTKQTRSVTVGEGATVTVDFKLEPSANVLDQVVVTGTIAQTELKAVPNAMTVITAKQIEERGITKIDQLFRGDIPGLFAQNQGSNTLLDEVTMFSRGATALSSASVGTLLNTNPIKTYVDGIELADPKYLSQIDPKSIERIEILAGPQASTIYGSNAINGVMQIFTKRGSVSHPQFTLNVLSGWAENNFSSAHTPQHDYSAQLNGVEGRLSYNAGGSWNYMGPWTPAKQTVRMGGFGGVRIEVPTRRGLITTDFSLRRSNTQNIQRGDAQQANTNYRELGLYTNFSSSGLSIPATRALGSQTIGLTFTYIPINWWSHELGLGSDVSDTEFRYTARGYLSVDDTTLRLDKSSTNRRSLRYSTTSRIPIASTSQLTVTAGADNWQSLASSLFASPQTLTGPLTNVTSMSRRPSHNTGGFIQTQLGITDQLFLTYGLRAEWNPDYGEEAEPNMAPRYGVAYTQNINALTAKIRASYGRSTRPPAPSRRDARVALTDVTQYYGNFDWYFANSDLAPEHQQGGEGGLELYFGTRGSLIVTRYNQTVDGLIDEARVDSVRSSTACWPTCSAYSSDAEGYGYYYQFQYINLGAIRNQGWEAQGSMNIGPVTTRGTYSWTKSRVIGITPKYRAQFAPFIQYRPGATYQYLPEHTWALGISYAHAKTSVALNINGIGRAPRIGSASSFFFRNLTPNIRLNAERSRVALSTFFSFDPGYTSADLSITHRFFSLFEGVLQIQNLMDYYRNDFDGRYAVLGRQVRAGFRLRTP